MPDRYRLLPAPSSSVPSHPWDGSKAASRCYGQSTSASLLIVRYRMLWNMPIDKLCNFLSVGEPVPLATDAYQSGCWLPKLSPRGLCCGFGNHIVARFSQVVA